MEKISENVLDPRDDNDSSEREKFIRKCIKVGMSYAQIGKTLKISRQRVYYIYRYGYKGHHPKIRDIKRKVKDRDNNKCRICKKTSEETKLHIHHLDSSKDNSLSNLITLCPVCHRQFDTYTKKLRKEYQLKKKAKK